RSLLSRRPLSVRNHLAVRVAEAFDILESGHWLVGNAPKSDSRICRHCCPACPLAKFGSALAVRPMRSRGCAPSLLFLTAGASSPKAPQAASACPPLPQHLRYDRSLNFRLEHVIQNWKRTGCQMETGGNLCQSSCFDPLCDLAKALLDGRSAAHVTQRSRRGASSMRFPPLHTVLKCTISNAGMLVDSHAPSEIFVTALRVLSAFHSRIVVRDGGPQSGACTMAEHHKSHCATLNRLYNRSSELGDCKRKRSRRSGCRHDGGGGNDSGLLSWSNHQMRRIALGAVEPGAELFDFSRPFEDPYNVQVTQRSLPVPRPGAMASLMSHFRVAEDRHAKQKANTRKHNRKYAVRYLHSALRAVYNPILSHRSSSRRKLSRRQKSFEALLSELAPDELEQYRLVLTRDFTTSDEESEDERGRERLRVRELPWESDRVRELKRRLDELYLRRFATHKQRDQLARCRRDGSARSSRPPPELGSPTAALPSALASLTSAQPRNGPAASDCSFDGLSGGPEGSNLEPEVPPEVSKLGTGSGSGPMPGTGSFYEKCPRKRWIRNQEPEAALLPEILPEAKAEAVF
uniref:Protein kinase domain-containing protein n=1 Tax=Macrostomum lignano TaxID=282301 RepID=A0A1I8JQB0_9PLAT